MGFQLEIKEYTAIHNCIYMVIYYSILHVSAFYGHYPANEITKHFKEGIGATVIFNDRRPYTFRTEAASRFVGALRYKRECRQYVSPQYH
jgi:hypothetical protein